jgi:hypothetical protein
MNYLTYYELSSPEAAHSDFLIAQQANGQA